MRTLSNLHGAFRTPWDRILGAESNVRALRVLDETDEPMSVRELSRRTQMHLRAMQLAVEKLEDAGILELVGTGSGRQVRLRRAHPLAGAIRGLFKAERLRVERVLQDLKAVAQMHGRKADAIWLEAPVEMKHDKVGGRLRIGVLAPSRRIDALVDTLRERIGVLMRRHDVTIEVRGWTKTDLEVMPQEHRRTLEMAMPLLGSPPGVTRQSSSGRRSQPRSHVEIDAKLRNRGRRIAEVLAQKPELIGQARNEVAKRLVKAAPQEARTLREWQQLLQGLSPQRLRRWLLDSGEEATRLRQSMPVVFLRAASEPKERKHK